MWFFTEPSPIFEILFEAETPEMDTVLLETMWWSPLNAIYLGNITSLLLLDNSYFIHPRFTLKLWLKGSTESSCSLGYLLLPPSPFQSHCFSRHTPPSCMTRTLRLYMHDLVYVVILKGLSTQWISVHQKDVNSNVHQHVCTLIGSCGPCRHALKVP